MAEIIETCRGVRHMAEKSEAYDLDKPCQQQTTFQRRMYLMFFKANGVQDGATGVV